MGKYIAPQKKSTGRVGMATKRVIIDMDVDISISEEEMERIENDVAAALRIDEIRQDIVDLQENSATKEDIAVLDNKIVEVSQELDDLIVRVENLERTGGLTPEQKQEIIDEVIDELHEEGITPIDINFDSGSEDLIIDKG